MTAEVVDLSSRRNPSNPGNGAPALVARYLAEVYPARGHGKTDCGEMLDGLSDADHFLIWLGAEGYVVVPLSEVGL